jgi:Trypsin-like peptidase domain
MPRIWDSFTGIAVYIYGSLNDAKSGDTYSGAGSGFVVEYNHETNPKASSLYVVTNKHVVMKAKTPVIRFNRKDETVPECFPTREDQWKCHPHGDDVAVFPMDRNWESLQFYSVNYVDFVTPQLIDYEDIGIGDDTVMVGRFITHEGKQRNSPSVRYGNIAMMNKETIWNRYLKIEQESFLVEIRSLPGYSGSAVFLYSPCAMNDMSRRRFGIEKDKINIFSGETTDQEIKASIARKGPYLLGIDWCHLQSKAYVVIDVDSSGNDVRHPDRWFVNQNSGMAGVIPAWKILDILESKELMEQRRKETERMNRNDLEKASRKK